MTAWQRLENGIIKVNRMREHEYRSVGETVDWPVDIRTLIPRNGSVGLSLNMKTEGNLYEEEFLTSSFVIRHRH